MTRIQCTFYRPEQVSINEYNNIVGKMEGDLNVFCSDQGKSCDIIGYAEKLLLSAEPLKRRPEMYFLGLDEPHNMPSDARVEYFYKPTYIAAAIIIRAILLHPGLLESKESTDKQERKVGELAKTVFPGILLGCTGRGFAGHGYDEEQGRAEAMNIFAKAGTSEFVAKYPEFCKEFTKLYNSITKAQGGEEAVTPCVWYAAYGSNLNSTRFQEYLEQCGGCISETENRPYIASGKLYFAADSRRWGLGKGVAFFDETGQGTVLARIYKVSRSQFEHIQRKEGDKYARTVLLGAVDDIPVYTCTSPKKREDIQAPSLNYVRTILDGLKETYPDISENVLLPYLFKCGAMSDEARKALAFIRRAPHAVTIREMMQADSFSGATGAREAVLFLSGMGLVKQDSRSVRAGHRSGEPEAKYFTVPDKRDITDMVLYGVI